jgi:hypothetical protein
MERQMAEIRKASRSFYNVIGESGERLGSIYRIGSYYGWALDLKDQPGQVYKRFADAKAAAQVNDLR